MQETTRRLSLGLLLTLLAATGARGQATGSQFPTPAGSLIPGGALLIPSGQTGPGGQPLMVPPSAAIPLPITPPDDLSVTGSVTSAASLFTQDTTGYQSFTVFVTSAGSGSTIVFEGSNDNTNWIAVPGINTTNANPVTGVGSSGAFSFGVTTRYFRARVSSYGSGTASATAVFRAASLVTTGGYVNQGQGQLSNAWYASLSPQPSGGLTRARVNAAVGTNATVVKSGGGQVYGYALCNAAASARYVRLFNLAAAPTVGSSTPAWTIAIAAGTCASFSSDLGIAMATGVSYDITGGNGDSDATSVAANDVTGFVSYN